MPRCSFVYFHKENAFYSTRSDHGALFQSPRMCLWKIALFSHPLRLEPGQLPMTLPRARGNQQWGLLHKIPQKKEIWGKKTLKTLFWTEGNTHTVTLKVAENELSSSNTINKQLSILAAQEECSVQKDSQWCVCRRTCHLTGEVKIERCFLLCFLRCVKSLVLKTVLLLW